MDKDFYIINLEALLDYFVKFAKEQGLDLGLVYEEFEEEDKLELADTLHNRYEVL